MSRFATRKLVSSLAAILILAAGCAEQSPTAVELAPSTVAAAKGGARKAKTIRISAYHGDTYARVVGPRGGTVRFGIGELDIPRGALDRPVLIVARTDGSSLSVDFGPDGLTFNPDALPTLTFDLKNFAGDVTELQILHVDAEGTILEGVTTFVDVGGKKIAGRIGHFSAYAAAAP